MCPAKVTSPQGNIFFVRQDHHIHNMQEYEGLPLEDKKCLAFRFIIGREDGFTVRSDKIKEKEISQEDRQVTIDCLPLLLPMGTRIEPVTTAQMEDEIRVQQRSSQIEKYP